jgi:hypothetical protein
MIDGMQVVIEARESHLLGSEPASIGEPALEKENIEALARQI